MFIYTAKLNKKKVIAAIVAAAVVVCLIIVLAGREKAQPASVASMKITRQEDVETYLESLGWEISQEPIDVQEIVIPMDFSDTYGQYNDLQKKQGYDLTSYAGFSAVRYTYEILNYTDDSGKVVADIIVSGKQIVAADIQSVKLDGFMHEMRERNE